MGVWIKVFSDGSSEIGTDAEIVDQKASWSRGRLDNIESIQIYENRFGISCTVQDTDWHQFDRYISFLNQIGDQCNRVFRCVQAEIQQKHVGQYIIINRIQFVYFVSVGNTETDFVITDNHIGKWLTAAITYNGKFNISISSKGKLNEQ